nr:hypothetical protein [Tanacetum cinerariifolium]
MKNMMIYLRNVAGFKMDYFKRMTYDDICPIFEKKFNSNVAFLQKIKEQMEEEDSRALKRISKSQKNKAAKKQKLDEEVAELKRHLQIVPNVEDDVYTKAIPLACKVLVVDYEIYTKNNKPYYKIIRADESPQLFLRFLSLLRNFDREDLEVLWELVKERFASSKPKNFSDDFLLNTLTYMFVKPDVQAQVWKNQRTVHGLAKVKSWRLLESCGVHIITFTSTQMNFLVERRYPLTRFTLDQMLSNVRLEVEEKSKFAGAISSIHKIVQRYMDQQMNETVKVAAQIQSDRLRDEAQAEKEEFLKNLDENIQKIIKEQVKEQVKTSYAMAVDLSEMELKKILIKKMESNKSIHRSDEERNLYKALVKAYESDKIILDKYGDTVILKKRRDNKDKDEEPSAGSDRGESAPAEEPMQTTKDLEEPSHQEFKTATHESIQLWISDLAKQADSRSSFNELMDTPVDFSAFLMNRLKVDTLTPKLLAGLTYELMKRSCKSLVELEFFLGEVYKATTDQLDWNNPKGHQYPHNLLKPLPLIPNS